MDRSSRSRPPKASTKPGKEPASVAHPLPESELETDVKLLAALGNDTRYEALRLIADADGELCVCELEPTLGVSQSAISQALSRLSDVNLVSRRKEGRWRYYAATPRASALLHTLDRTRDESGE